MTRRRQGTQAVQRVQERQSSSGSESWEVELLELPVARCQGAEVVVEAATVARSVLGTEPSGYMTRTVTALAR